MIHRYVVAIGAGCAAALLFAVSAETSPLAMALAYLAPLPIMIATLGWGLDAGAIAGAVSVAAPHPACRSASSSATRLRRDCCSQLPSRLPPGCWRPSPSRRSGATCREDLARPGDASVGAIVMFAAVIGMLGAAAVLTSVIVVYGGYAEGAKQVAVGARGAGWRRLRGRRTATSAQDVRRVAGAIRSGGDRGVDAR